MGVTLGASPATQPVSLAQREAASDIAVEGAATPATLTARGTGSRRRWLPLASVVVVVAVAGAWLASAQLGYLGHAAGESSSADDSVLRNGKATLGFAPPGKSGKDRGSEPEPLATVPVEVVQRNETLRLTGTLVADEKAAVASNASGIVAEMRVDRGSVVRKNDVLAQLDPVDAQNRLAEGRALLDELKARLGIDQGGEPFDVENQPEVRLAKASLELAECNLNRAEDLYPKKAISTEALDQARTEHQLAVQRFRQTQLQVRQSYQAYRTALTRLAILEKAVADTTIRAPFDGWVAEKRVAVGEQVTAGFMSTPIVTLVRVDPLRLSLVVPQQEIGRVRQGQTVHFQVDAFPDRTFDGTVQYITPWSTTTRGR